MITRFETMAEGEAHIANKKYTTYGASAWEITVVFPDGETVIYPNNATSMETDRGYEP